MFNTNFIDLTESYAKKMDLNYSRIDDNEISVQLNSSKTEYYLSAIFKPDYDMIYFSCDMNLHVTNDRYSEIADAILQANERIWVGHFDFLSHDSRIVYSFTIPMVSSFLADEDITENTINLIANECDRFYDYFAMIINSTEIPDFSIGSIFLESAGEA